MLTQYHSIIAAYRSKTNSHLPAVSYCIFYRSFQDVELGYLLKGKLGLGPQVQKMDSQFRIERQIFDFKGKNNGLERFWNYFKF